MHRFCFSLLFTCLTIFVFWPTACSVATNCLDQDTANAPTADELSQAVDLLVNAATTLSDDRKRIFAEFLETGQLDEEFQVEIRNELKMLATYQRFHKPLLEVTRNLLRKKQASEAMEAALVKRLAQMFRDTEKLQPAIAAELEWIEQTTDAHTRVAGSILQKFRNNAMPVMDYKKIAGNLISLKPGSLEHPRNLTQDQRNQVLESQVQKAMSLLRAEKDQQFIAEFLDPWYLIELMPKQNIDKSIRSFVLRMLGDHRTNTIKQLESFSAEPKSWILDGRGAYGETAQKAQREQKFCWIFREGRWLFSPLVQFGYADGPEDVEGNIQIDFFADVDGLPFEKLESIENANDRLALLRRTQKKGLESLETGNIHTFTQSFANPVHLAKHAIGVGRDINWMLGSIQNLQDSYQEMIISKLKVELKYQLQHEPNWKAANQIGIYPSTVVNDHDAWIWEFYEGRWRLNVR